MFFFEFFMVSLSVCFFSLRSLFIGGVIFVDRTFFLVCFKCPFELVIVKKKDFLLILLLIQAMCRNFHVLLLSIMCWALGFPNIYDNMLLNHFYSCCRNYWRRVLMSWYFLSYFLMFWYLSSFYLLLFLRLFLC